MEPGIPAQALSPSPAGVRDPPPLHAAAVPPSGPRQLSSHPLTACIWRLPGFGGPELQAMIEEALDDVKLRSVRHVAAGMYR